MQDLDVAPAAPGAAHIQGRDNRQDANGHEPGRSACDKGSEDQPHDGCRMQEGRLDELACERTHRRSVQGVSRGHAVFRGAVDRSLQGLTVHLFAEARTGYLGNPEDL